LFQELLEVEENHSILLLALNVTNTYSCFLLYGLCLYPIY